MNNDTLYPMQAEVFGYIFVLAQQLTRRTDALLAPLNLTTRQWLLVAVLVKAFPDQQPTLSATARVYGSSRQNVKQIALQLQERGYLRLVPDPADQRALRLALTEKIAVFDTPEELDRERQLLAELFETFSLNELEALLDLTRRWVQRLSSDS